MDIIKPKIVYKIDGEKINFEIKIIDLAFFAVYMDVFSDNNLKDWVKHYFKFSLDHSEEVWLEIDHKREGEY